MSGDGLTIKLHIEPHWSAHLNLVSDNRLNYSGALRMDLDLFEVWLQYPVYHASLEHDYLAPGAGLDEMTLEQTLRYRQLSEFACPLVRRQVDG